MSKETSLYQSKSNASKYAKKQHLPMPCTDLDAWTGEGFYFWESHEDLAHWWGTVHYRNNYVVAQAKVDMLATCLDLHNNHEHQTETANLWAKLKREHPGKVRTLSALIEFMKEIGAFNYEAIRFSGVNSVGVGKSVRKFRVRIPFTIDKTKLPQQYVDLQPPIQVCLVTEKSLNLREYKIIFDSSKK